MTGQQFLLAVLDAAGIPTGTANGQCRGTIIIRIVVVTPIGVGRRGRSDFGHSVGFLLLHKGR